MDNVPRQEGRWERKDVIGFVLAIFFEGLKLASVRAAGAAEVKMNIAKLGKDAAARAAEINKYEAANLKYMIIFYILETAFVGKIVKHLIPARKAVDTRLLYGEAMPIPFVCCKFLAHGWRSRPSGGFFYAYTAGGAQEMVAVAVRNRNGQLVYKPDPAFMRKYGDQLVLSDVTQWELEKDLILWLDALIYNSFLRCSIPGVPHCWYLKFIDQPNVSEMLPLDLHHYFQCEGAATWILLRHGSRVWSVQVIARQFREGWDDFCRQHQLRFGCHVVFACERQWVFSTMMFSGNGKEMTFDWSRPNQLWRDLRLVPGGLRTSCRPTIIEKHYSGCRFACQYHTEILLRLVFEDHLHDLIKTLDLEEIMFVNGKKTWIVQVEEEMTLHQPTFTEFVMALELKPLDYIVVAISLVELRFRVIVFNSRYECERLYRWV